MRVIYIQKTPLLLTVIYPREHKTTVFASRPESYPAATAIDYFTRPIPNPLPLTSPRSAFCLHNLEYPSDVRLRYTPVGKLLS
jgi:hypothetical protein